MVSRDDDAVERRQATRSGFLGPGFGGGTTTNPQVAKPKKPKKPDPRKKQKLLVKNPNSKTPGFSDVISDNYNSGYAGGNPGNVAGYVDPNHGYGSPFTGGQLNSGLGQKIAEAAPNSLFRHHLMQAGLPTNGQTNFGRFLPEHFQTEIHPAYQQVKQTQNMDLTLDRFLQGIGGGVLDPKAPVKTKLPPTHRMNPNLKPIQESIPKNLTGKKKQDAIKKEQQRRKEAKASIRQNTGTENVSQNYGVAGQDLREILQRAFLSLPPSLRGENNANLFGGGSTAWAAY